MSAPESASNWAAEADVIIFGAGAAGMAAALFAARRGQDVILCEATSQVGGTTSRSAGILWILLTKWGRHCGDTLDKAKLYLEAELGDDARPDLIEAFLASGEAAIEELVRETDVQFEPLAWPDYHPDQPGGRDMGRSLVALPFDGRKLREDLALVRPPMDRQMLFGGLMIGMKDAPNFLYRFVRWPRFGAWQISLSAMRMIVCAIHGEQIFTTETRW